MCHDWLIIRMCLSTLLVMEQMHCTVKLIDHPTLYMCSVWTLNKAVDSSAGNVNLQISAGVCLSHVLSWGPQLYLISHSGQSLPPRLCCRLAQHKGKSVWAVDSATQQLYGQLCSPYVLHLRYMLRQMFYSWRCVMNISFTLTHRNQT